MAGKAISVFSVKGGGGASLLAANLAVSLKRETRETVALVDLAHPVPGTVALYLGLSDPKAVADVVSLLDRLQPALLKGYLTTHSSGVTVVPAANDALQEKVLSRDKLERFVELLLRAYDYVVVDLGSIVSADSIPILDLSAAVCVVVTPEVASVTQARRAVEYLQSYHFSRDMMRLVLNRYGTRMAFPPETIEESTGLAIALYLPEDVDLVEQSISDAEPFVSSSPRHPVSKALDGFTQQLVADLGQGGLDFMGSARRARGEAGRRSGLPTESEVLAPPDDRDEIRDIKIRIHRRLIDEIDFKKADLELAKDPKKKSKLRGKTEVKIVSLLDEEAKGLSDRTVRKQLVKEILDEALGLGPLEELLRDPDVSEIMVNGIDHVYMERSGKIVLTDHRFLTEDQLRAIIERIVAPLGRRIDEKSPMVDARLEDGPRVNAIIRPLAIDGPSVTIRKFSKTPLTVEDLIRFGAFTPQMAQFFEACVLARQNVVISGGTGSGKIREQIGSAVDLVFQQTRLSDGSRRVTHVSEVTGREGEVFTMADIFLFKQTGLTPENKVLGQFVPTGMIPKFIETLQRRGIKVPREIFLYQTA